MRVSRIVAGAFVVLLSDASRAQLTRRVSVDSRGAQANDLSFFSSISADGRFVAFESVADNLVPGDTNWSGDVFLRDRVKGVTARVSVSSAGTQAKGYSESPSLSSDGRFVAFASSAPNLVPGDTNELEDVFVHDRHGGTTTRVSVATDGTQGNSYSKDPSISADGRFVAFESVASNLFPGDVNGTYDVFLHDRLTGVTTQESVDSSGEPGNAASADPAISSDGRFIVFMGHATNLVPADINGVPDVFVHERLTGATTRASVSVGGTSGNGASVVPSISSDGRFVAFLSVASNLVPGDTNGFSDAFVRDRWNATTERIDLGPDGVQANGFCMIPTISSDGRHVAFKSNASNLVPSDTNGFADVFVRDLRLETTTLVSVASDGTQGSWDCGLDLSISGDGRLVVFEGSASEYVPGDTNGTTDVFVHDRHASGFTSLCDPGVGGVVGCPCANPPSGPGRGCDNASGSGGAVLSASGPAYLASDELVFTTSGENPSATSILLQGNGSIPGGQVFGQGVRCLGGTILRRLYVKVASGGSVTVPDFLAGDPSVSRRSAQKGDEIRAGESRWYLVFYRDAAVAGCASTSPFNATQTGRVEWSL